MADLLLHSLSFFEPLLLPLLDAAEARATVEIGVEEGPLSRALIARAARIGGTHVGIDTAPGDAVRELFRASFSTLIEKPSRQALDDLPAMDAYFVDGDHNYRTVGDELILIERAAFEEARPFPLVVLHDIGWPWGRRDLYYEPSALPPEAVRPHSYAHGVTLDNPGVIGGGFRGEGRFACAISEGGPRNGVRTAVEDFMAGRDLTLFDIPSVFGLGVLASGEIATAIEPLLRPYDRNPLLSRLERNRLELYLRVIELQDRIAGLEEAMRRLAVLGAFKAPAATPAQRTAP